MVYLGNKRGLVIKEAQSTISKQQLDITLKGKANDISDQWKFPVRFVPLIRTHESIFIDFLMKPEVAWFIQYINEHFVRVDTYLSKCSILLMLELHYLLR